MVSVKQNDYDNVYLIRRFTDRTSHALDLILAILTVLSVVTKLADDKQQMAAHVPSPSFISCRIH